MGYINDLEKQITDYLSGDYEIIETTEIPTVENVAFGKKAYKIPLTALSIDLRKSTDLLTVHNKQTCGKIHKSFLTIAARIITENGGQIRSFNGDSILAFWKAQYKSQIEKAVSAAFQIKWAIATKFQPLFNKYTTLDFGIGIDFDDVYIVRSGLPRNDNNNDLVFLGMCVNYATAIARQAHGPNHIEISEKTYSNLTETWIYGTTNGVRQNMWVNGQITWKEKKWSTKCTHWHQTIES